jgi:flagellum-specific peptidoglycan hydrolase FlgJ
MKQFNSSRYHTPTPQSAHSPEPSQTLWKLLLISAIAYLVWSDIKLSEIVAQSIQPSKASQESRIIKDKAAFVSLKGEPEANYGVQLPKSAKSTLAFAMDPGFAQRYQIPESESQAAIKLMRNYVEQYATSAVSEMQSSGIPASITLAQGLLESGVGTSKLARSSRNHFGIKCFSRTCARGHCVNFTDDTHKDFFVKYKSVWESYRAHSRLLKSNQRYRTLFQLNKGDFQGWAQGLSKQGYATDPKYAQKLIAIIKTLNLHTYDQ